MVRLELPKDYYIINIDDCNWGVCYDKPVKSGKRQGLPMRVVDGYYPNLPAAARGAMRTLSLKSLDNKDLLQVLTKMEKISKTLGLEHA